MLVPSLFSAAAKESVPALMSSKRENLLSACDRGSHMVSMVRSTDASRVACWYVALDANDQTSLPTPAW